MKLIGLTGGISSGKSTVTKIFTTTATAAAGDAPAPAVAVIDLDVIARQVVARGTRAYDEILRQFAEDADGQATAALVDEATGELDRKRLGALVFSDPVLRKKLQAITHRPIFLAMAKQLLWHLIRGTDLVILDAPLLYETGLHRMTSAVVVVYAPDDVQLQRLMKRDGIDEREARLKIQAQMPLEKKRAMADFVIDNSGDLKDTEKQARSLLLLLRSRPGSVLLSRWTILIVLVLFVFLALRLVLLLSFSS